MRKVELTDSVGKETNPTAYTSEDKSVDQDRNLLEGQIRSKRQEKQQKKIAKMEESIRKCNQYLKNHQYQSAITKLKNIIEDNQLLDLHEFQGMGNSQSWNGHFKDGAKGLLQFSQQQRKQIMNVFDLLALGFVLWIEGDQSRLDNCLQWYFQVEERYEIYFGLANLYYNCKIYTKAEQFYKKSVEMNNKCAKTYEYLGWIYGYWFKFDTMGIPYIKKSLTLSPQSIECEYLLAVLQRQLDKKEQLLKQILKRDPKYYRVYLDLSQLQQDLQQSLFYIDRCIQADEKYMNSYLSLIKLYIKYDNYSQAIKVINKKVFEINLQSDYAHYYMGMALQNQNKYSQAISEYQECLKLNPYNVDANLALGELLWDFDRLGQAINSLERQLKNNPFDYKSANLLGTYFDQIDDFRNAALYFQLAVSINDQFGEGYLNLGTSLSAMNRNQQAVESFNKAIVIDPKNSEAFYYLALCYKCLKDTNAAIESCYQCIDNGCDQDKDVYLLLGYIYQELNNNQKALQFYLKHSAATEQFHTENIFANLISHLPKEQVSMLLKDASEKSKDRDDFINIEIAKLAILKQIDKIAIDSLNRLKINQRKYSLRPVVFNEWLKIKDNSRLKLGIMSYMSKMDLVTKKKEYEKKFNFLFQL